MFDGDFVFVAHRRRVNLFLHGTLRAFVFAEAIADPTGALEQRCQILVHSLAQFALLGHCSFELPHAARLAHLPYGKDCHGESCCGY